ncbi:MAG: YaeQ family protein [Myxococcota bacterium]
MALGSTVLTFDLAISDLDRGVYEEVAVRAARHPSESGEYLVARILAYALEYREGIAFTAGLAAAEEPAIEVRDLTGARTAWIEVGTPDGPRLHRATKACEHVAVYCHRDPEPWLKRLSGATVFAPERLQLYGLDPAAIGQLATTLGRRATWSVSRAEGELYVDADGASASFPLRRLTRV